jgi:lipoate-protein ligase B
MYPILSLERYKKDLHWYVHRLEDVVTAVLARHGVAAAGDPENPGVWVNGEAKVAALGIKVRRWVTMHGLALNVEQQSLDGFNRIVPCGIQGKAVTSLHSLLEPGALPDAAHLPADTAAAAPRASGVSLSAVADDLVAEFARVFNVKCAEDPALTAFYDADPALQAPAAAAGAPRV